MLYLTLLAVVLLFVAVLFVIFLVFPWLAEENILFTTVKEGTIKGVMHGKSIHKFLMSFAGYHLNDPTKEWYDSSPDHAPWEVIYHGEINDKKYDDRSRLLKYLGLYWVGWPWRASVFVYRFEWNETKTNLETKKEEVRSRSELTDFIFVSDFTYAVLTDAAETSEGLPTDELTLVTVAIRNPYRALFSGEDWMRRVTSAINRHVRNFVGKKKYEELISSVDKKEFSGPIIDLNQDLPDDVPEKLPHGLEKRYGVEIRTADLQIVELTGAAKKEYQEASTAKYTAERKAEATRAAADATAYSTITVGNAEAKALESRLQVIDTHKEAGIALAGYDAIQKASENAGSQIIWANNPIAAVAGLLNPKKSETKGDET